MKFGLFFANTGGYGVKADSARTQGTISLIEQLAPPGFASPLHLHHGEDEPMYILEGEYTFWIGEQVLEAGPGAFVFLPRDLPHCFRVEGTQPGRLLQLTMPGGLERAFEEAGRPTPEPVLPPAPSGPPSQTEIQRLFDISAAHHVETLGPPPGAPGFPLPDPGRRH